MTAPVRRDRPALRDRARAATRASSRRASARATRRRWRSSSSSASTARPPPRRRKPRCSQPISSHHRDDKFTISCDARRIGGLCFWYTHAPLAHQRRQPAQPAAPPRRIHVARTSLRSLARPRSLRLLSPAAVAAMTPRRRHRARRVVGDVAHDPGRPERLDDRGHPGRAQGRHRHGDRHLRRQDGRLLGPGARAAASTRASTSTAPRSIRSRARARRHRRHHGRPEGRVRAHRPTPGRTHAHRAQAGRAAAR